MSHNKGQVGPVTQNNAHAKLRKIKAANHITLIIYINNFKLKEE